MVNTSSDAISVARPRQSPLFAIQILPFNSGIYRPYYGYDHNTIFFPVWKIGAQTVIQNAQMANKSAGDLC